MKQTYSYTVYMITNKINGKTYIGSHKTKNLNDNYMGSGKYLKRAIEKHGLENFQKDILFVFKTSEEMYAKEAELVNEDYLTEGNTYNLKLGGQGGFDYISSHVMADRNRKIASKRDYSSKKYKDKLSQSSRIKNPNDGRILAAKNRQTISDEEIMKILTKFENNRSPVRETCREIGAAISGGLSRRIRKLNERVVGTRVENRRFAPKA